MKNATVYNEAVPTEGSERFYRGAKAGEATPAKGLVFSRDRADAAAYAAKIGGELSYVDVPKSRIAELKPAAHKPDARVIVSADLARERRVAEAVEMAQVAPGRAAPASPAIVPPAEYREPAHVAGSQRFYHGGKQDEQPTAKGMVFSRDAADAGRYAFKTGGQLSYIDVAKERMSEVQPSSKAPATRVVVSPALARERQAVPILQSEERETASMQPMPTATAEGRQSASVKRPRAAKAPSAETVESKAESSMTSKAGGQRPRTARRARADEATETADPKGSAAEAGKTPEKSGRMAALRDKQSAVGKQSPGQDSGHEM
jgi:hypothetical protein